MHAILANGKEAWSETLGAWNQFWFAPRRAYSIGVLRIIIGLAALAFFLSWSQDLVGWFGVNGILPPGLRNELTSARLAAIGPRYSLRFTPLDLMNHPIALYTFHTVAIVFSLMMTAGVLSRLASVGVVVMMLSYMNRAPMITGLIEPVLLTSALYLCLAPSGDFLSIDRWLKLDRFMPWGKLRQMGDPSVMATIALRLLQLHLCGFYLAFGLWKLAGATWWEGSAMWWLAAHPESRLIDLTSWANYYYVFNLWTHFVVLFHLAFPLLVWRRDLKAPMLALAVVMWVGLALVSGYVFWCLFMLAASFAFFPFEADEQPATAS